MTGRRPRGLVQGGIDEAGRGPVLGPLVVAGVAADPETLHELGCKDSKKLSPAKRERIARLLEADPNVHVVVRVIEAHVLDAERATETLNHIELVRFREIAAELGAAGVQRVTVDAADVNAERFGRRISEGLDGVEIHSQHRADAEHVEVAAASIVAKVTRDQHLADLARRLERVLPMEMGSGYPSDPKTKAFLAAWVEAHGDVPEGARRSWETVRRLLGPRQTTL